MSNNDEPHEMMVEVKNLTKAYTHSNSRDPVLAVQGFSAQIKAGEFVTFFGPNGCGKSTILKVLAGLEVPEEGTVSVDSRPPGEAEIGYIFQDFRESLFPWRTALENIAFPLEFRGKDRRQSLERAKELCEKLGMKIPINSYAYQLSGGQMQMVAIARALIYRPKVLLMDEPFSALDYQTNAAMEDFLLSIWQRMGMTILFVSHEIDQAIYLAQRILMLTRGPARVAEEITVSLNGERTQSLKNTAEFLNVRLQALEVFGQEAGL